MKETSFVPETLFVGSQSYKVLYSFWYSLSKEANFNPPYVISSYSHIEIDLHCTRTLLLLCDSRTSMFTLSVTSGPFFLALETDNKEVIRQHINNKITAITSRSINFQIPTGR